MTADLAVPLRTAIVNSSIAALLPSFNSDLTVFTSRPVDPEAPYPLIIISPDIAITDNDGVHDQRPVMMRDISVYGSNETPQHYRDTEQIARMVRDLFHRKPSSFTVTDWAVVSVTATGPRIGPVDDDVTIGRIVTLTIQLAARAV